MSQSLLRSEVLPLSLMFVALVIANLLSDALLHAQGIRNLEAAPSATAAAAKAKAAMTTSHRGETHA